MYRKWLHLFLFAIIIIQLLSSNSLVNCSKKASYKNHRPSKKASNYPIKLTNTRYPVDAASNLKLDEIIVPIKKLTRKKMIKLLIKSIKRVNKNAKLSKSDLKSVELRPTIEDQHQFIKQVAMRRGLQPKDLQLNDWQPKSGEVAVDRSRSSGNQINFAISDKNALIRANVPSFIRKLNENEQIKLVSTRPQPPQYSASSFTAKRYLKAINNQQVPALGPPFNNVEDPPMNPQLDEETLHRLHDHLLQTGNQPVYHTTRTKQSANPLASSARNEDQIIRIHIPLNELAHYPVYVNDQLNSTSTQHLIRTFIKSQLDRTNPRSDNLKKEQLTSRLLNFIARQLDIDTDRNDETALQTGLTNILGSFVGKCVCVF